MPSVTITHDDGSEDVIPETAGWSYEREIGKMNSLRITVPRTHAETITLEPKQDEVELADVTTGRLVDIETGGSTWTLVVYSFEWDAKLEPPTSGGVVRSGSDDALVSSFVSDVSSWTEGSIASLTGGMEFVFNHAFAHEALRRIERNVPGELQFNPDHSVDYVDSLGTDKADSVTLSSDAGNLNGEIRVRNKGRKMDATHLRVIGAHEGEAQLSATLVPSDDPNPYENRVDYSTGRWSQGDPRNWDRWSNKDVSDEATIREEAAALADDLTRELVEAEATIEGVDLDVGDWVRVEKPDADLSRDMRVHRIVAKSSGAKVVDEVLLSTRTVAREGDTDRMRDIQRYNVAFQGSAIWNTTSGGIQPVSGSINYQLPFYYPSVEFEHQVEIYIAGRPYRAYSQGAASGGGSHSHTVTVDHPEHSHTVTVPVPYHTHPLDYQSTSTSTTDSHSHTFDKAGNQTSLGFVEGTNGPSNSETDTETSNTALGSTTEVTSGSASSPHTHDPEPGVIEFSGETPSGCDVLVNGSVEATGVGGGVFETTVDLSGALNKGAWNTIEVSSDSLGHCHAVVSVEAYRQLGVQ